MRVTGSNFFGNARNNSQMMKDQSAEVDFKLAKTLQSRTRSKLFIHETSASNFSATPNSPLYKGGLNHPGPFDMAPP